MPGGHIPVSAIVAGAAQHQRFARTRVKPHRLGQGRASALHQLRFSRSGRDRRSFGGAH
jgi:hypothetical protein